MERKGEAVDSKADNKICTIGLLSPLYIVNLQCPPHLSQHWAVAYGFQAKSALGLQQPRSAKSPVGGLPSPPEVCGEAVVRLLS